LLLRRKKAIQASCHHLGINNHKEDIMTKIKNTIRKNSMLASACLSMTALAVFFMPAARTNRSTGGT